MLPVTLLTCSCEPVPTEVVPPVAPKAVGDVIATTPALLSMVTWPVKPLLSPDRVRVPTPSLVSWDPVVPRSWPEMVRLDVRPTLKNCWLPGADR